MVYKKYIYSAKIINTIKVKNYSCVAEKYSFISGEF